MRESFTACRTVKCLQHGRRSVLCLKLQGSFKQYRQRIKLVLQQLFTVFTLYTRLYLSSWSLQFMCVNSVTWIVDVLYSFFASVQLLFQMWSLQNISTIAVTLVETRSLCHYLDVISDLEPGHSSCFCTVTWLQFSTRPLFGGRVGLVVTVTVVQGRRAGVRSPFLSKCPDGLWGQFDLLLFAYWEWSGLCLVLRLGMSGNVPPFFWVDSWMTYEEFCLFIRLLVAFTLLMCGCYFKLVYS